MSNQYFPMNNFIMGAPTPQDNPNGLWGCVVDREDQLSDFDPYFNFLEVHRSSTWDFKDDPSDRKVVFRVSKFIGGEIRLGECVILDKKQVTEARDLLNQILSEMA